MFGLKASFVDKHKLYVLKNFYSTTIDLSVKKNQAKNLQNLDKEAQIREFHILESKDNSCYLCYFIDLMT